MKKIFSDNDKFDHAAYSEHYVVTFTYAPFGQNYWTRDTRNYYAAGKNAHKAVAAKFKQDCIKDRIQQYNVISVVYQ